jgi:superfamily I DNA/RNA helicase
VKDNPESNGINFERLKKTVDSQIYSARVNHDYRAILLKPKAEDVFMFAYVDKHDDAYRWAERRRFEVNRYTGTFQMYLDSHYETDDEEVIGLFSSYTSDQLLQLGVPLDVLPQVFVLKSEEELLTRGENIPEDARLALQFLTQGDKYEDVLDMLMDSRKPSTTYMESFMNTPEQVTVITSDQHLQQILSSSLEQWRLFLHPSQLELVRKDFSGPVRVLGGAGTGKTVVALHRARYLLKHHLQAEDRLLLTTFTSNLAEILSEQLDTLIDQSLRTRVEVKHIDRIAREICEEKLGLSIKKLISKNTDWEIVWSQVKSAYQLNEDICQLAKREFNLIIDPEGIEELDSYLEVVRTGMKTRLRRTERQDIWYVVEKLRKWMIDRGWYGYSDLIQMVRRWIIENLEQHTYQAAIVDEVQDFSQQALKFVRALVPVKQNDLFFVGDPQQRIYANQVVMSRCGIDIRGSRSKRLRINYRTTEQIRQQAMHVLKDVEFDDLNGEKNVKDDISLLTGTKPIVNNFSEKEEEIKFVVNEIQNLLTQGFKPHEIGLFTRQNKILNKYVSQLEEENILVNPLNSQSHIQKEGVHYGTMHRSKGLEFRVVFLVNMTKSNMPLQFVVKKQETEDEREIVLKQERSLFYVACTRARERLYISSAGNPSPFLMHT